MKPMVYGILIAAGVGLAAIAMAQRPEPYGARAAAASPAPAAHASGEMIVLQGAGGMLTVVDPRQQVLAVYGIDAAGKISLLSVRNIRWDLQMTHLNNSAPLPQEIRALLDAR